MPEITEWDWSGSQSEPLFRVTVGELLTDTDLVRNNQNMPAFSDGEPLPRTTNERAGDLLDLYESFHRIFGRELPSIPCFPTDAREISSEIVPCVSYHVVESYPYKGQKEARLVEVRRPRTSVGDGEMERGRGWEYVMMEQRVYVLQFNSWATNPLKAEQIRKRLEDTIRAFRGWLLKYGVQAAWFDGDLRDIELISQKTGLSVRSFRYVFVLTPWAETEFVSEIGDINVGIEATPGSPRYYLESILGGDSQ